MEHSRSRLLGESEMNKFIEALTSKSKSAELPEEYNVGSWKLNYTDHSLSCSVVGEWYINAEIYAERT